MPRPRPGDTARDGRRGADRSPGPRREAGEPRSAPRGGGEPTPLGDAALEAFGTAFDAPVRVRTGTRGQVVVELRFADSAALSAALERLSAG